MRDYRVWIAIVGFLLAGRLIYPVLAGDRRSAPVREEELQQVVYVCQESGETFLLRAKACPEPNPKTGRATLMPGLYCPKCEKWRPSASLAVLQQNPAARLCPQHRMAMSTTGPVPEKN